MRKLWESEKSKFYSSSASFRLLHLHARSQRGWLGRRGVWSVSFSSNFNLTTHLGYYLRLNVLGKLTCEGMVGAVCSVGQVRRITLSLSASINVYPKNRRSLPTILQPGLPSGPFLICSSGKWIWHCRPQPNLPADQSDNACLIMLKYVRFNQYLSADLIQFAHTWSSICDQSQLHFRCSHIVNLLPDLIKSEKLVTATNWFG